MGPSVNLYGSVSRHCFAGYLWIACWS